jgi:hypothetical protein
LYDLVESGAITLPSGFAVDSLNVLKQNGYNKQMPYGGNLKLDKDVVVLKARVGVTDLRADTYHSFLVVDCPESFVDEKIKLSNDKVDDWVECLASAVNSMFSIK